MIARTELELYGGPTDIGRSRDNRPFDIDIGAPIAECDRIVGERFRAFKMDAAMPITMRPDDERSIGSLRLAPADAVEAATLHHLRDRLADDVFSSGKRITTPTSRFMELAR